MRTYFVHAKSAFEGVPNYSSVQQNMLVIQESALAAFAPSRKTLEDFHARQRHYFSRNPPLSMEAHTEIAAQVLIDMGAPEAFARQLAAISRDKLLAMGITRPTRTPWSRGNG